MTEPKWSEREDEGRWRGEEHPELPYHGVNDPQWESKEEKPSTDGPNTDEGEEV